MMGRRRELESLRVALHESSSDGCVATVIGEAGIGKSRLVEALLATAAADGAAVLAARAFPAEGSIAYAPIVELLRTGFAAPGAARRLAGLAPATLAEVERLVPLPPGCALPPRPWARRFPGRPRPPARGDRHGPRGRRPRTRPGHRGRRGPALGGRRVARGAPLPRAAARGAADPLAAHVAPGGP